MPAKPVVFIGCSTESLDAAKALQRGLDRVAEVQIWNQGVFKPTHDALGSLLEQLTRVDFGVFILTPDDIVRQRGKQHGKPRDNVVFELGMWLGALGRERVAFLVPRDNRPELPSDLKGVEPIDYNTPQKAGWDAAIGSAASRIESLLSNEFVVRDQNPIFEDPAESTTTFPTRFPLSQMFIATAVDSQKHLKHSLSTASKRVSIFGLTRNYLVSDVFSDVLKEKSRQMPVSVFLMDPDCEARKHRYSVEPIEAALEDPGRYKREVIEAYREMISEVGVEVTGEKAGLRVFTFNFPCSFAIELFDDTCRVMLYGHGKRGTESPIFVFERGSTYFDFFESQIEWLHKLTDNTSSKLWLDKGVSVKALS